MSSESEIAIEVIETNGSQAQPAMAIDPPKRNTASLELMPDQIEKAAIARNQLMSLTKKPAKKKSSPVTSDSETLQKLRKEVEAPVVAQQKYPVAEIIYDGKPTMNNLSSAIISKEDIDNEIRKKMTETRKDDTYDIEIPQELILSELTSPSTSKEVEQVPLDGQELIDILEGNPDNEGDIYEFVGENGMFLVKQSDSNEVATSYEIVSSDQEKLAQAKKKVLERQIAIQQIASMPVRKNRRTKTISNTHNHLTKQSLAQSLAMDWSDKEEEVLLELEDDADTQNEPKIKILNMTIVDVNDELTAGKAEPKILNINAPKVSPPKILNKNAPQMSSEKPAMFKSNRVIKKKLIWDPSSSASALTSLPIVEKSDKSPIPLPASITIKKLTKESIAIKKELPIVQIPVKKGKKKSEIDKLFQDEGAVNMIYSLERRNNNRDVPEVKVGDGDNMAFVDKSEEKSALIAKQKSIRQTILKQSTSPPEIKVSSRPQRVKRDLTPSKPASTTTSTESTPVKASETPKKVTKAGKGSSSTRPQKTDESWDFVRNAQTTCDDAMIIRRHSSSSYESSTPTSPRRLSVDQFTKPQDKKTMESPKDLKSSAAGLVQELRNTLSTALTKGKIQGGKGKKRVAGSSQEIAPQTKRERRIADVKKEFSMTKFDGIIHVILLSNQITISLLIELKTLLSNLENDDSCKVVLLTVSDELSHGLEYSTLIQTTIDKRKHAASDLVTAVK